MSRLNEVDRTPNVREIFRATVSWDAVPWSDSWFRNPLSRARVTSSGQGEMRDSGERTPWRRRRLRRNSLKTVSRTRVTQRRAGCPRSPARSSCERLFHLPHRCAAMFGETIKRAEFGQGRAIRLCASGTRRLKSSSDSNGSILPLPDELFGVFLAQSVYDAKSEPHRVVIDNRATPIGLRHANRLNLYRPCRCASFTIVAGV